ncbi:exodeoxyribonuclease III [Acidihalobacter yilgarnensis]|uniref:Exodeoxyribonuclease III n=1 Tax=Acidihalobacter yilgarnensis TaxID=2819280 RepID=A0A1D8ISF3_9GAMM|nr:exodeoxyribonuclease III [Acidihalobacter yilgarnensis]AOU99421.1 exodeoxyribonuclease III [Acidihalobacter yilgarnensis]
MKIASWNVNSLNVRLEHVKDWLASERPDILAIQETKLPDDRFPADEFKQIGYEVVFSGQKTYNGVALLARSGFGISNVLTDIPDLNDPQRRILAADVGKLRILNLYVVNGQSVGSEKYAYKMDWLNRIVKFIESDMVGRDHYIILGDFNIAPDDRDVHDPEVWQDKILCSKPERAALEAIKSLGFSDTFRLFEQSEASFSWWDYRAAGFRRNIGLRIDLLLANTQLAELCVKSWIDRTPRTWDRPSDHAPIVSEFTLDIVQAGNLASP